MYKNALFVVVKGDKHKAALAAAERGIPFAFYAEHHDPATTTGFVPESHADLVQRWFSEPPNQAPFPEGSCIHFQFPS